MVDELITESTAHERAPAVFSRVLEHKSSDPGSMKAHFSEKLKMETDASDVYHDLKDGVTDFVLVDARSPESYAKAHIPGAYNMPHRKIDRDTVQAALPEGKVYVLYCTGVGCNAAPKAALKLADLGLRVKELAGGLEWWEKSGYPVAKGSEPGKLS